MKVWKEAILLLGDVVAWEESILHLMVVPIQNESVRTIGAGNQPKRKAAETAAEQAMDQTFGLAEEEQTYDDVSTENQDVNNETSLEEDNAWTLNKKRQMAVDPILGAVFEFRRILYATITGSEYRKSQRGGRQARTSSWRRRVN